MPINQESLQEELYDFLKSQGYRPTRFDSSGKKVPLSKLADVFKFEFKMDDVVYGEVYAAVIGRNLVLFNGDDVLDSPNASASGDMSFNKMAVYLKGWAHDHQLGFERDDIENLEDEMAKREDTKKLDEGYYPMGKKASYNDSVPNVKIKIQHSRAIEEGEQRYRNIARIYLENQNGERFLLNTKKPGIARVYARHIAEGGKVNDDRWIHVDSLVEEYTKMAGFVRATRNNQFNESTQELVSEGVNHYMSLRETLHKLSGKKGYNKYFESYTPTLQEDMGIGQPDLAEMFVSSSIDPRIEHAMPILAKLIKPKKHKIDEVIELEEWTESVINEKLKPQKEDQINDLANEFADEIALGDDAVNVKYILSRYKLEDDDLFDFLKSIAEVDRDADARPAIIHWLGKSNDHDHHRLLQSIEAVMPQQAAPQPAPAPAPVQQAPVQQEPAPKQQAPIQQESLRDGEHYIWTVHFDDGTTKKVNVSSDEFDVKSYYAKKGKKVTKVDKSYAVQGQQYDAPKRGSDDSGERADRERQAHIKHDRRMTEEERGMSQRARDAFKDLDSTPTDSQTTNQQDLEKFRDRVRSGQVKSTKLQDMNPLDREQWEREKQQQGIKNETKDNEDHWLNDSALEQLLPMIITMSVEGATDKEIAESLNIDVDVVGEIITHFVKEIKADIRHEEVDEGLDKNQKRVGQLGPTEKVKNNNIGKLVGASESVDPLLKIKKLSGLN